MVVYGIDRLLELTDMIELAETERKRSLRDATADTDPKVKTTVCSQSEKSENDDKKDIQKELQPMGSSGGEQGYDQSASVQADAKDAYEVDNDAATYEVVTYHRSIE